MFRNVNFINLENVLQKNLRTDMARECIFRAFGVTNLIFSAWCKTWWSSHGFNVSSSLPKKTLDTSLTLVIFCGNHKNMSHKTDDDPLVSEHFQIFTVLKSFSERVFMLLWSYQRQAMLLDAFLRMLEYIFCSKFQMLLQNISFIFQKSCGISNYTTW